jgi:hypothetical protein
MTDHDIETALALELRREPRREAPGDRAAMPPVPAAAIMEAAAPERITRQALLAELEDLRLLFQDLRVALATPEAKTARLTSDWTALDVVAHLASWAAETRRETESLLAGTAMPYAIHFEREGGPRAWNQREVDERAHVGLSELVEELDRETERVAELVVTAPALETVVELPRTSGSPPQRWRMPIGAMIAASCWHARLHLRRLMPERI